MNRRIKNVTHIYFREGVLSRPTTGINGVLISFVLMSRVAVAQEPKTAVKPITPPSVAQVYSSLGPSLPVPSVQVKVKVDPPVALPQTGLPTDIEPPTFLQVRANAVQLGAIIQQIRSGSTSAEEAWQRKSISQEDVLWMLGNNKLVDYWEDQRVRDDLINLLVQHEPEIIKKFAELPPLTRWTLGHYYYVRKNEQAVPVLSTLLHKNLVPQSPHFTFQSVEQLAWFYRDAQQYSKSAQTWEAGLSLANNEHWMVPDANFEIVRSYANSQEAGSLDKAKRVLLRLLRQEHDHYSEAALTTFFEVMIERAKPDAIRQLLTEFEGQQKITPNIAVILKTFRGRTYYMEGDFDAAQQQLESLSLSNVEDVYRNNLWFANACEAARSMLHQISVWKETPFVCEPASLFIEDSAQLGTTPSMQTQLKVRAIKPYNLSLHCNDAGLHAAFDGDWVRSSDGLSMERNITVNITFPGKIPQDLQLHIQDETQAQISVEVPVQVQEDTPVEGEDQIQ